MSGAFTLSRLLVTTARAFPRPGKVGGGPTSTFGARLPACRLMGEGRLFAHSNGNGGSARGAHTTTAAARTGAGAGKQHTAAEAKHAGGKQHAADTTELVFEPFEEVQHALDAVRGSEGHDVSLAREEGYSSVLEEAVNAQINVEQTISHIYHSMYAYFDRDNVALPGLARYFRKTSNEEREHAEKLIDYQNRRGGRVRLSLIPTPLSDFDHAEKGDALNAMELALSLEKLNYEKLKALDKLAVEAEDFNLADYVDELLDDQTEDVKRAADYVSQLRRVGKGHGTWAWDQELYEKYE